MFVLFTVSGVSEFCALICFAVLDDIGGIVSCAVAIVNCLVLLLNLYYVHKTPLHLAQETAILFKKVDEEEMSTKKCFKENTPCF